MRLSSLQKYILRRGLEDRNGSVNKKTLLDFYRRQKDPPTAISQLSIITKSVERLISRGLVRGGGIKTARKWYIDRVMLTPAGRKLARRLLGEQQPLPFKNKNNK
ncbi:MAG TPA: hypothetical protein PKG73_00460 [bacterium]|nr:hypothetical protein [bacterium]